jgi:toxin ParE1/3/4
MEVRWAPSAVRDLERIFDKIRKDNPAAAERVIRTIYEGCAALVMFPERGRPGRVQGRRELVFAPLPYIAVYRVKECQQVVEISRIYHGAQNWP